MRLTGDVWWQALAEHLGKEAEEIELMKTQLEPDLVPAWRKGGSADPIKQLVKDAWVLITNSHLWVVANFNTHEWEQYGVNLRCSFCPINTDSDMSQ